MTTEERPAFLAPTTGERIFNRMFGTLVGLGLAPGHMFLLEVRGRKSGKVYRTPVDLLEVEGKLYLVAPRGRTQWVRNAEAAGEIVLKRGSPRRHYRLRAVNAEDRLPYLKAYLDRFKTEVQRYFPLPAGSPPQAFAAVAENYPVFELLPI
jgi:deazaflavin-dependent oxidoreductase (nitroreductase family)